jgi:hypothetical protein
MSETRPLLLLVDCEETVAVSSWWLDFMEIREFFMLLQFNWWLDLRGEGGGERGEGELRRMLLKVVYGLEGFVRDG